VLNVMRSGSDSIKATAEDIRYEPEKAIHALGW